MDVRGMTALHYACLDPQCVAAFPPNPDETLNLSGKRLSRLAPNFLQAFPNLTALDLSNNQFTDLPTSFLQLTALTSLNLAGNPFRLPPSLPELREALQKRASKRQHVSNVTVIVAGDGRRNWLYSQGRTDALFHSTTLIKLGSTKKLRILDTLDPVVFELLLYARAIYVLTASLPTLNIANLLKQVGAVGLRVQPPVIIVATEAERITSAHLGQCKEHAEQLAAKYSVNLVGFFVVADSARQQGNPVKDALFQHASDALFSKSFSRSQMALFSRLAKTLKDQSVVNVAELEQFGDGVQELVGKASELGRVIAFQDSLFDPTFVVNALSELLSTGLLFVTQAMLVATWSSIAAPVIHQLIGLFAQTGILLQHTAGLYIVPSNAPELTTLPELSSRYTRQYKFNSAGPGLARRLLARLAHIEPDSAKLYRKAVLFYRGSTLVGAVETYATRWMLSVAEDLPLFLELVGCVESLLAECSLRTERSALLPDGTAVPLSSESADALLTPDWTFNGLPTAPSLPPLAELGQGGGGTVYTSRWMGFTVAVKQFKDAPMALVAREIRLSFAVEHPNLVTSFAAVLSPPALVMELFPLQDLCHGFHYPNEQLEEKRVALKRTLALLDKERRIIMGNFAEMSPLLESLNVRYGELTERQRLVCQETIINDLGFSLELRVKFMLDIAKALQALHGQSTPILHNDVRSPNVFVVSLEPDAPVHCKLGDFGLAQRLYGSCRLRLQTFQWLAPEVLRGEDFGLEADVFSFAVVMWELIHSPGSVVPYEELEGVSPHQLKKRIIQDYLRPSISPAVHQRFSEEPIYWPLLRIMADCWLSEAQRRPTASELVMRLQALDRGELVADNLAQVSENLDEFRVVPGGEPTLRPDVDLEKSINVDEVDLDARLFGEAELQSCPWWRNEAANLDNQRPGTFFVRPSSQTDHYAVEYVDQQGQAHKLLIVPKNSGYSFLGQDEVYPSVALLVASQDSLLLHPFTEPNGAGLVGTILSAALGAATHARLAPWQQLLNTLTKDSNLTPTDRHRILLRVCSIQGIHVSVEDYLAHSSVLDRFEIMLAPVEADELLIQVDHCLSSPIKCANTDLAGIVAAYHSITLLAQTLYM